MLLQALQVCPCALYQTAMEKSLAFRKYCRIFFFLIWKMKTRFHLKKYVQKNGVASQNARCFFFLLLDKDSFSL